MLHRRNPSLLAVGSTLLATLLAFALTACGDDTSTGGGGSGTGANPSTGGNGGEPATGGSGGAGGEGGTGGTGGGGGTPGYEIVECDDVLTPPATGICEVTSDGTSGKLLRGTVLGPNALYHNGGVLISDAGVIECVGCDCATAPGGDEAAVVDCAEGVISPGLINPHDHITYANNAPYDNVNQDRYNHRHEWRTGANGMPEINYNSGASADVVRFAELRFVMSGATSTTGSGGQPGLLRNLDTNNLEGLPTQAALFDTFPLDDADGTLNDDSCNYGNAPTTAADIASKRGYLPHIAEGIGPDAQNEFVCTSDESVANANDVIAPQTAVIHAIGMNAEDFAVMRTDLAAVIWSPRSNVSLYGDTARVTMIDALGVPIALGTDWMPSGSMNLSRELRCADELNELYMDKHFSDLELWRMVTENAAFATGTDQAIGMLKPGYTADIAIFDGSVRTDFRAVVDHGVEDVVLVLRGGEPLYGDAALLDDDAIGGSGCEPLPVCNLQKKACVAQDIGGATTLNGIVAAGEAIYPLFYCHDETPETEPSCVPWREEYPDGITATDGDGDGIADADDICPAVFDPIRPLDGAAQADADGDGIGDSCDACPLTAGEDCAAVSADDFDGDGTINAIDGCPEIANEDQADGDGDGHGDACDACPGDANPGPLACALSIVTVRNPADPNHPAEGTPVSVSGFVTAIKAPPNGGFTIQESTDPFAGIFVFTGSQAPTVAIGNEVAVSGVYDEFFEYSELTSPAVTVIDPGTTLPFAAIPIANPMTLSTAATAEPYESMLVSIGATAILVQNSDGPAGGMPDFDEFTITGNLRVNDTFFLPLDNNCIVTTAFTAMTGILDFSFSNYKLEPRSGADIGSTTCQPYP